MQTMKEKQDLDTIDVGNGSVTWLEPAGAPRLSHLPP
jgi:hypothetical protein